MPTAAAIAARFWRNSHFDGAGVSEILTSREDRGEIADSLDTSLGHNHVFFLLRKAPKASEQDSFRLAENRPKCMPRASTMLVSRSNRVVPEHAEDKDAWFLLTYRFLVRSTCLLLVFAPRSFARSQAPALLVPKLQLGNAFHWKLQLPVCADHAKLELGR